MSRECLQKKCALRKKTIKKDKLETQGTPHARRCHRVGGLVVVGNLKTKGSKSQKTKTLCFDGRMKIFIDAVTLKSLEAEDFGL